MPALLTERLELFNSPEHLQLLTQLQRGVEKESLRVSPEGRLAQTPHPQALGAALTHPSITTDFSEALMELITPVSTSIDKTLNCLDDVHRFVYSHLDEEKLWTTSMPCVLAGEEQIPVAQYGSSNVARMKTVYRLGLGNRYGRAMQTIAGIHYNFSLPEQLWPLLQQADGDSQSQQDYITNAYFGLIRNFRRTSWLLVYLFGASPAVCKSFLNGRDHQLEELDHGSVGFPHATALRMGDLGYQSDAQGSLNICYNTLDNYIDTLKGAITQPHPDYEDIGVKGEEGYRQLSTALLQIENEFYSPIRPKRVTQSGETPIGALRERGVEYIEVRCIDVNPYLPMGIDAEQMRFIDCFLLYCLFDKSPLCDDQDRIRIADNLRAVVNNGREPDLQLNKRSGAIKLQDWGNAMLNHIEPIAKLLDQAHGGNDYQTAFQNQRVKMADSSLTPSAKILADMKGNDQAFFHLAKDLAEQHNEHFRNRPLDEERQAEFTAASEQSLDKQREIEQSDNISFEEYLSDYYQQYQQLTSA